MILVFGAFNLQSSVSVVFVGVEKEGRSEPSQPFHPGKMSGSNDGIAQHIPYVALGTPPAEYSYDEWKVAQVHFHDFKDLPSTIDGGLISSPEFTCLGRKWILDIYPGGDVDNDGGDVALYLTHRSLGTIDLTYHVSVTNANSDDGEQVAHWCESDTFYERDHKDHKDCMGTTKFASRSDILGACIDGTLVITVRMTLIEATNTPVPHFIPQNPLCKHILAKFMDEDTADVVIEVGSESDGGGRGSRAKKAKTTKAIFYSHKLILQDGAPALAEMCKSAKKQSPIHISDVKPEIFHHILNYVYGEKVPEIELKANAKDVIDASDKFGVVGLKLEAEACYASSITLSTDNVLDILLYADAKNCALLKEVVMDFVVENGKDIIDKVSFENAPGSMLNDLLTAMTRGKQKDDSNSGNQNYGTMRVSTLREKLHEKGLDIDGSRESMIKLLKEQ